jgi:hypothetical protein
MAPETLGTSHHNLRNYGARLKAAEYADVGRNSEYHAELRRGNFVESGHSRDRAVDGETILSGCMRNRGC